MWLFNRKKQVSNLLISSEPIIPQKQFNKTVLVISDIHRNHYTIPDCKPDFVLFLGDIPWEVVAKLDKQFDCPKLGLLGNHDGPDYLDDTSVIHIHGKTISIGGISFAGFGGSPRYNSRLYGQYTEEEASLFMDSLGHVDVFLAHANPRWKDVLDDEDDEVHAGFECFKRYIERCLPTHFFHGHTHEQVEYEISSTKIHSIFGFQCLKI